MQPALAFSHTLSLKSVSAKTYLEKKNVVSSLLSIGQYVSVQQLLLRSALMNNHRRVEQPEGHELIYLHAYRSTPAHPPVCQVECYLKQYRLLHSRRDWCSSTVISIKCRHVVPLRR
jgi:hypothetical protein